MFAVTSLTDGCWLYLLCHVDISGEGGIQDASSQWLVVFWLMAGVLPLCLQFDRESKIIFSYFSCNWWIYPE